MKALFLAGALALSTGVANAQAPICAGHDMVVRALLGDGYALISRPTVTYPVPDGRLDAYVDPTGRWVMISVSPTGQACIIFMGYDWHSGEAT